MSDPKDKKSRKMPKYPPKPNGRPIKLTPEVQDKIVNALMVGNYFETACAMAGIHKMTAYDWLKLGSKDPESIYGKFSDAVAKAQGESEGRDVMVIEMTAHGTPAKYDDQGRLIRPAAPRNWQAAAWRLERKFPTRWGRTDRHEHTGQGGGPITFTDFVKHVMNGGGDEED